MRMEKGTKKPKKKQKIETPAAPKISIYGTKQQSEARQQASKSAVPASDQQNSPSPLQIRLCSQPTSQAGHQSQNIN